MASPSRPFAINAPGYLGLNTQDAPVGIDDRFMLEGHNCVIDKFGRVGSRKGWAAAHTANANLGTSNVECIAELVQGSGTRTTLAAGGGFLFKHSGTTLTTLTYGGGGAAPTISANNWQAVGLNGVMVFFQRTYDPLIYDPAVSTTTFRRLSEKTGYTGTVPLANCALAAYGRIWCSDTSTDKNTVSWSDILTVHNWTAGTSGSLNLVGAWPQGGDEITALAAHNGFLIIFGKKQTLIYSGANDPSTMVLQDTLSNVGCISRDSVQNTGEDVIFLSDTGVRSLRRTIQEKSAPLSTLSKNVHNDLQAYIDNETVANIKSVYSPIDAFYLLTFPTSQLTYCFDLRAPLPDGSARVTTWSHVPKAFCFCDGRMLYFGEAGRIGLYSTYYDNGSAYRMSCYTSWIDFGNPIQKSILKKVFITLIGATNQAVVFKWGFDFITGTGAGTKSITTSATPSEYNIAEYGIGEYHQTLQVNTIGINAGGSGKVIQIGFEAQLIGYPISIQKIEIYTKDGKN